MAKLGRKVKWGLWIAVLLLAGCGGLRQFEHSLVYRPSKDAIPWPSEIGETRQDVYFATTDGVKLNACFFPAATNSPRKQMVILVCHGNGGNVTYLSRLYTRLAQTGANVLLFDYRGYGKSEGRPNEEGTYLDAQAAYQWLRQRGFVGTNIFSYGESLGGGIATELAMRETTGGLVLESTGTSIPDMGRHLYPWLPVRTIGRIKYDTYKKLPALKVPVLIMNSRTDGLVPFEMGERNFAAANQPKMFFEITGGHVSAGEDYHAGMEKFLSGLEAARMHGGEAKF